MANTTADLLGWRETNQDKGLQYWLFSTSIYLREDWEKDNDKYKINKEILKSWMEECYSELEEEGHWNIRKDDGKKLDRTRPARGFFKTVVGVATNSIVGIAEDDGDNILVSSEIYLHSNKFSELYFRFDSLTMAERILRWTDDDKEFIDAKNAILHMFGLKKRSRFPNKFREYKKLNKSLKCVYCDDLQWKQTDHIFPWSMSGNNFDHAANWIPACRDCNGNKSAYVLGKVGWEKVRDFYNNNPNYVGEMKNQHLNWKKHYSEVKRRYGFYDSNKQGWNGYKDMETLGNITEILDIIQKISEM